MSRSLGLFLLPLTRLRRDADAQLLEFLDRGFVKHSFPLVTIGASHILPHYGEAFLRFIFEHSCALPPLVRELESHRVPMLVDIDVIVGVHSPFEPFGALIRGGR